MRVVAICLPDDVGTQLELLADDLGRAPADIAAESVRQFVRFETEFVDGVRRGLAAAARGDFASEQQVAAVFDKYRGPEKKKPRK